MATTSILSWWIALALLAAVERLPRRARAPFGALTGVLVAMVFLRWLIPFIGGLFVIHALWLGAIVALWALMAGEAMHLRNHSLAGSILIPATAWCGLEYFRSEVGPVPFPWLPLGGAQHGVLGKLLAEHVGVYGIGFVMMAWAGTFLAVTRRLQHGPWSRLLVAALAGFPLLSLWSTSGEQRTVPSLFRTMLVTRIDADPESSPLRRRTLGIAVATGTQTNAGDEQWRYWKERGSTLLRSSSGEVATPDGASRVFFPQGNLNHRRSILSPVEFPTFDVPWAEGAGTCRVAWLAEFDTAFQQFSRRCAARGIDVLLASTPAASAHLDAALQMRGLETARPVVDLRALQPSGGSPVITVIVGREPKSFFSVLGWIIGPTASLASLVIGLGMVMGKRKDKPSIKTPE